METVSLKGMSFPTIYVLIGIPGSGKSSWAEAEAEQLNAVIVSRDGIRAMLTGRSEKMAGDSKFESLVSRIVDESVACAIQAEKNIILDGTNIRYVQAMKAMYNVARSVLYPHGPTPIVTPVLISTPLDECLKRNARRGSPVPEDVIHRMHSQLEKELADPRKLIHLTQTMKE